MQHLPLLPISPGNNGQQTESDVSALCRSWPHASPEWSTKSWPCLTVSRAGPQRQDVFASCQALICLLIEPDKFSQDRKTALALAARYSRSGASLTDPFRIRALRECRSRGSLNIQPLRAC